MLGYLYQRVLLAMPRWYQRLTHLPRAIQGVVPFVLLIAVGYFTPNLLGGGNSLIVGLANMPSLLVLLGIFVIRFIFSMISYGSGLPGGIFLPILSLGKAVIGAVYGVVMNQ